MKYKKITLAVIAKEAHVSLTTASMILSARPDVSFSQATIDAVMKAAETLGYTPSRKHKKTSEGGNLVLIACPNISNPYYSRLVQAIQQEANANGYSVLVQMHYRDIQKESFCVRMALDIGAKGIIFAMTPSNINMLEQLKDSLPIVVIGDKDIQCSLDTIELNDYDAGCMLASHLLSLGHKHFGFISTSLGKTFPMRQRRLQGVKDTLSKKCPDGSLCVYSRDVTPEEELGDIDLEYNIGYQQTVDCIEEKKEVTALIAVNDAVAAGVIDAITSRGYKIPKDYSVCGCDNIGMSRYKFVSLTTVEHQLEEKGRYAFHVLQNRIANSSNDKIFHVEYANQLMERSSTGRVRIKSKNA